MHALRFLHIVRRYVTDGCLLQRFAWASAPYIACRKRNHRRSGIRGGRENTVWVYNDTRSRFRGCICRLTGEGRTAFVHVVGEGTSVPAIRTGMPC